MLLRQEQSQLWQGSPAWTELDRRLQLGRLSQTQIDTITELVLARQADLKQKWDSQRGDFLERARALGKLSDNRWAAYASQGLTQSLSKSKVDLMGNLEDGQGMLMVSAYISGNRMGFGSGKMLFVSTTISVAGNGLKHVSGRRQNYNSNLQFSGNQNYITSFYDLVVDRAVVREARTTPQTMHIARI